MQLSNILNKEGLDVDQLQKGLKHIGFNLSKFDSVAEDQVHSLIELFKRPVDIDPVKSTKFAKMDLRSKLEKVLKVQPTGNNPVTGDEALALRDGTSQQKASIRNDSKIGNRPSIISVDKKLGKIKFFDSTKGFGCKRRSN